MKKITILINDKIRNKKIRIVGETNPTGEIDKYDALEIAKDYSLDLVLLSTTKEGVGICKVIDYQKYLYDKKKQNKDLLKKQKANQVQIKEIRMTPNTDDHDYNFKLKHAINFLKDNNKVKVTIFFKGREIMFRDKGEFMILRFVKDLEEYGTAETMPKLEGKRMSLFVKPKK